MCVCGGGGGDRRVLKQLRPAEPRLSSVESLVPTPTPTAHPPTHPPLPPTCSEIGSGGVSPAAVIMAPTRELAMQISEEARKFARPLRLRTALLYGGAPKGPQGRDLARRPDIVIATPGRLNDFINTMEVDLSQARAQGAGGRARLPDASTPASACPSRQDHPVRTRPPLPLPVPSAPSRVGRRGTHDGNSSSAALAPARCRALAVRRRA